MSRETPLKGTTSVRPAVAIGAGVLGGLLILIYSATGWYVSGEILGNIRVVQRAVTYDTDILAVGPGEITLKRDDGPTVEADRDAVMGLRWEGGYGQVGPAISFDGLKESRPLVLMEGVLPRLGEDVADFDGVAFPADPSSLGIEYRTVAFPAPLGALEAWLVSGRQDVWLIAVHGLGVDRSEYLRLVDTLRDLGHPILMIRYRNDEGAPSARRSLILAGQSEWKDVSAAVDYALENGASGVIICGDSMGGALTLAYAMNETRDVIRGLVLEAPLADLREVIRLRSGEALPIGGLVGASLMTAGRIFVSLRTGLDFDRVDYVDRAGELTTPVLLFHGTVDEQVPFEIGESLAAARPDLIEFHALEDAAHIRAWNEDPKDYARILIGFLKRVAGGS